MVSTRLKNISQIIIGSFPQEGVKIKNVWNHHLVQFNQSGQITIPSWEQTYSLTRKALLSRWFSELPVWWDMGEPFPGEELLKLILYKVILKRDSRILNHHFLRVTSAAETGGAVINLPRTNQQLWTLDSRNVPSYMTIHDWRRHVKVFFCNW